jgi:hypothetical protein
VRCVQVGKRELLWPRQAPDLRKPFHEHGVLDTARFNGRIYDRRGAFPPSDHALEVKHRIMPYSSDIGIRKES